MWAAEQFAVFNLSSPELFNLANIFNSFNRLLSIYAFYLYFYLYLYLYLYSTFPHHLSPPCTGQYLKRLFQSLTLATDLDSCPFPVYEKQNLFQSHVQSNHGKIMKESRARELMREKMIWSSIQLGRRGDQRHLYPQLTIIQCIVGSTLKKYSRKNTQL